MGALQIDKLAVGVLSGAALAELPALLRLSINDARLRTSQSPIEPVGVEVHQRRSKFLIVEYPLVDRLVAIRFEPSRCQGIGGQISRKLSKRLLRAWAATGSSAAHVSSNLSRAVVVAQVFLHWTRDRVGG